MRLHIINLATLDCFAHFDNLISEQLRQPTLHPNYTFLSEFSTKWKAEVRTWNLTGQYPYPIQRVRNLSDPHNSHRKCNNCSNQHRRSRISSSSNNSRTMLRRRLKTTNSNCPRVSATTVPRIQHIYVTIRQGLHRTRSKSLNLSYLNEGCNGRESSMIARGAGRFLPIVRVTVTVAQITTNNIAGIPFYVNETFAHEGVARTNFQDR